MTKLIFICHHAPLTVTNCMLRRGWYHRTVPPKSSPTQQQQQAIVAMNANEATSMPHVDQCSCVILLYAGTCDAKRHGRRDI